MQARQVRGGVDAEGPERGWLADPIFCPAGVDCTCGQCGRGAGTRPRPVTIAANSLPQPARRKAVHLLLIPKTAVLQIGNTHYAPGA